MTRLHIDWTRCDGRGLCTELLPEVLARDEWGYPLARDRSREPDVPAKFHRFARAAVKRCPRLALRLLDDTNSNDANSNDANSTDANSTDADPT